MIRGSTKIFLETLAGVVVAALLAVGFATWRLSTGPISIDSITPYIENALSDKASGRRVIIGTSSLAWDTVDHAIEVRTDRVSVFDGNGLAVMVVPEMAVRFSIAALLRGIVVPRAISLVRPAITVVRTAEGGWEFSAVPESDPGTDPSATPRAGDAGAVARQAERELALLDRFRVIDARLVIDDKRAQAQWVLPRVTAGARRLGKQIVADANLVLEVDGAEVPLRATGRFDAGFEPLDGEVAIAELVPARLARRLIELAPLAALDLPLDATVRFAGRGESDQPVIDFKVTGGAGRIARPELVGGALPVSSLALEGRYVVAGERLILDTVSLAVPGAAVTASVTTRDLFGNVAVEGMISVPSILLDDLRKYWPPEVAVNPRRWIVTNLTQGTIRDVAVRFAGRRVDGAIEVGTVDGQMAVEGARVRYLPPQPPLEQVAGTVRFNQRQFDITARTGRLRGVRVESGTITITGLEDKDQIMTIDAALAGSVSDTLALLDLPPFGYVKRFGVNPQEVAGEHSARLKLRFPLIDRLALDDVTLGVTGSLRGLKLPRAVRDLDLTEGRLDLNLDKAGMGVAGEAKLAGVPATVAWTEHFERNPPFRRRYDASATVDDAQRRTLGVGFLEDYLSGPAAVTVRYVEAVDRKASLTGTADLRPSTLKIEDLGWQKPPGAAASGTFALTVADGRLQSLDAAEVSGGGLTFRGSGAFGAGGKLARLDIAELKAGASDFSARAQWQGERLDLALTGRSVDATTLLADSADPNAKPPRAMTVSAKLGRVVIGDGRQLDRVELRADSDGKRWRTASLSAVPGTGSLALQLAPRDGRRELTVTSDDAGAVLKTFGITEDVRGGRLRIAGRYDDSGAVDKLIAQLGIEEFRVVRTPMLANLLAVTSITGIPEILAGEGIAFQELAMQLVKVPNRLEITDAKASGLSIGLTAQGTIQGADDVADLTGTIVPFVAVNSLFDKIPLIGDLMTGRGGGLFAFTYKVTGPLETPSVAVNPLSVLAPGFVRNLFHWLPSFGAPQGSTEPPPVSNQQ